jgi:hypothetical protein
MPQHGGTLWIKCSVREPDTNVLMCDSIEQENLKTGSRLVGVGSGVAAHGTRASFGVKECSGTRDGGCTA